MKAKSKTESVEIEVLKVERDRATFRLVGDSPMILNRMSNKVNRELLLPRGKKTQAEKAGSLKHLVYDEFMASPYTSDNPQDAYIQQLSTCFKRATMGAALDLPGANKSQIGRLCWVSGERVSIYGVPKLIMSVTRSADINRTPDIRTRCILPEWACEISFEYTRPLLNAQVIANLLATAGMTQGIGDWRPQKGSGNYGQFHVVAKDDPDYDRIVATGGRAVQLDAMNNPEPYDDETRELLAWYDTEVKRRGFEIVRREVA